MGNVLADESIIEFLAPQQQAVSGTWFSILGRCTNWGAAVFIVPVQPQAVILRYFWTNITGITVLSRNATTAASLTTGANPTWYGRSQQIILVAMGQTSAAIPLIPMNERIEKPEVIYVSSAGTTGEFMFIFEDLTSQQAAAGTGQKIRSVVGETIIK